MHPDFGNVKAEKYMHLGIDTFVKLNYAWGGKFQVYK